MRKATLILILALLILAMAVVPAAAGENGICRGSTQVATTPHESGLADNGAKGSDASPVVEFKHLPASC